MTLAQSQSSPVIDTQIGAPSSVILGGTLTYTLTSLDGKTVVTQGVATSSASFDRFPQRFANIRANRDAEIKLAKDLAPGAHPAVGGAGEQLIPWSPSKRETWTGIAAP